MAGAAKSKVAFIVLAIFLGELGIHDFYAGYTTKGVIKLVITLISLGFLSWVSWIWALIEAFTIKADAQGVEFA
mgnify:CR=1 FL=1